jgi:hypothetical protein
MAMLHRQLFQDNDNLMMISIFNPLINVQSLIKIFSLVVVHANKTEFVKQMHAGDFRDIAWVSQRSIAHAAIL